MDFSNLLTSALAIVSIATLAGLGLTRGTVVNLREQLSDSRAETKALKEGRVEDQAALKVLGTDLAALTRVVTGEAHWVAIGQQLDHHHGAAMTHWTNAETTLTEIRDAVRKRP